MMLMSSGPHPKGTYLLPTRRKLEPNDIMFIEADTKYMGYQGQSCETVCVGTPPPTTTVASMFRSNASI